MNKRFLFFCVIFFFTILLVGCTTNKIIMVNPICKPAHFFSHTNATLPVFVDVWRNITFDQDPTELIVGASHDPVGSLNHTFNITEAGIYKFQYFASFTDSSPAPIANIAMRIIKNGIEINGSTIETDATKQNLELELSNTVHVKIDAGDTIAFQFISGDADVSLLTHSTFGVHPDSATVTMVRIDCRT